MNVDDACRYLNNRLDARLMFEGQVVNNLSHKYSACRQLYDMWLRKTGRRTSYEDFKKMLRFRMSNGWVVANVGYDPVPVIATAAGLTALAAGGVAYAKLRKHGSPVNVAPSIAGNPKLDPRSYVRVDASARDSSRAPKFDPDPRSYVRVDASARDSIEALKLDLAPNDTRPALFTNVNNSCYFHASMLMLYQMRTWYFNRRCKDNALLSCIDRLLREMETKDRISGGEVTWYYSRIQREMFPRDINRQQDANEFFLNLFLIMGSADCDLTHVSFKTTIDTCFPMDSDAMIIRSLTFNAKPIDDAEVRAFEQKWFEFEPEFASEQKKFTYWTVIDGKITKRTQADHNKPNYQPQIQSADANPFDSLDFEVGKLKKLEELTYQILNLVLPKDRSDVCKLVEEAILDGQTKINQLKFDSNQDLFNYKTKSFEKYKEIDEYLMVLLAYDPTTVGFRQFEYLDTILIGPHTYRLTCVIYRIGCGRDAGHYTAALFVNSKWIYYDDSKQMRKEVASLTGSSGVPFMLLFQRVIIAPV